MVVLIFAEDTAKDRLYAKHAPEIPRHSSRLDLFGFGVAGKNGGARLAACEIGEHGVETAPLDPFSGGTTRSGSGPWDPNDRVSVLTLGGGVSSKTTSCGNRPRSRCGTSLASALTSAALLADWLPVRRASRASTR